MKYKVEFAEFHTIEIEAESIKYAEDIAAVMEDEEIFNKSVEHSRMVIWNINEVN